MKLGFIGVGIMGRHMASHLQKAGHELLLLRHRSELPQELLDGGAAACTSATELAREAEIVFLMLPDTPDVERVLFGADGVADGVAAGKLLVDMSSIDPLATRNFATRLREKGCAYVDAPVSGGEVGARNASLSIMVGADAADFERVRPLFDCMGKNITHVGDVGAGQTAKVANQIIVAMNIQAVAEALSFAERAGADPRKVRAALMGGFAGSRVLDVHGERMLDRNFKPGFRVELHQKDLNLALGAARTLGMALPGTAVTQQMFGACAGQGWLQADHSSLYRVAQLLAGGDHSASE